MKSYKVYRKGTNFEEFFIVAKDEYEAKHILRGVMHDKAENYDIEMDGFDVKKIDGTPSDSFICDHRKIEIWNKNKGVSLSKYDLMYNYYINQITL